MSFTATLVRHDYPHLQFVQEIWHEWIASCLAGFKQRLRRAGRKVIDDLARRAGHPNIAPGGGRVKSSGAPGLDTGVQHFTFARRIHRVFFGGKPSGDRGAR